jgi:hypothetical protein
MSQQNEYDNTKYDNTKYDNNLSFDLNKPIAEGCNATHGEYFTFIQNL